MPQAKSTTSMPRANSPRASSWVLPCSREIARAISSALRSSNSLKRNMNFVRLSGGIAAQALAASFAAATAACTSSAVESGSEAISSPVAGLNTGATRRDSDLILRPPIAL